MKNLLLLIAFLTVQLSFGQSEDTYKNDLIELAKDYSNFHFGSNPTPEVLNQIQSIPSFELVTTKKFIAEILKENNQIATKEFLNKPDTLTLKNLYIIRCLEWNMHDAQARDNNGIIDSLLNGNTNYNELVSCYYNMLFTSVGNKNKPFDMSGVNFNLNNYNLQNDTEKGIFFLEGMGVFGMMILGYINTPSDANYKMALSYINKYPKYNGQVYYNYKDLNFKDFKLTIDNGKPKESYKKYYINKYMNTLLYHSLCLSQKKKDKDEKQNVLLGSILRNESYWKYYEKPELLQDIFYKTGNK